jgi:hypothetical protein
MSAPFSLGRLAPNFRSNERNGHTPKAVEALTASSIALDTSPDDLMQPILEPNRGALSGQLDNYASLLAASRMQHARNAV